MSSTVFSLDIIITLLLAGALLYSYGDWMRQRVAVTVSVLIAWYFSFLIIFILPLDVSSTAYRQCLNMSVPQEGSTASNESGTLSNDTERDINAARNSNLGLQGDVVTLTTPEPPVNSCEPPYSLLSEDVLPNLWRVVYWSSQLLTWIILPLMQSYTQAGEFTVWGKLRSALWDNAIFYASYVFIAVILIIYIALQPDLHLNWERTKAIAAAASNTWGLFVLVLMLGYGLIEVPRNCWNRTQKGYQLNRAYFKVAKLMTEKSDAEEALDDALISLNSISNIIGQSDARRAYVDTILNKVPLEMMEKIRRRRTEAPFASDSPSEKALVKLHRSVIVALQNHHRCEAQWADMTQKVFELEDINRNLISNEHVFKHTLSRPPSALIARYIYNPTVEWYWKCLISPLLLRLAAGVFALLSLMIIWSEITFFSIHPPLSLFALFVSLAKHSYSYMTLELICFVTLCYLSLCVYYTVFKIRVLNYYYLASNHQSDEYTLLFSGALLCRLTPPLCLNFLSLIHMDSHVTESQAMEAAYTRVMGHMDVVSIVSDYFNIYFPIALLVLTLATYFSIGARLLTSLGFQQFLDQDSEVTSEYVEEGKEHIKREKRRIQRLQDSANRRREFAARFRDDDDIEAPSPVRGDARYRQSDIVKGRSGNSGASKDAQSSPERSLLPSSGSRFGATSGSPMTETVDLSSPMSPQTHMEPPRNIFDDL